VSNLVAHLARAGSYSDQFAAAASAADEYTKRYEQALLRCMSPVTKLKSVSTEFCATANSTLPGLASLALTLGSKELAE
jgi:hypothetical protein